MSIAVINAIEVPGKCGQCRVKGRDEIVSAMRRDPRHPEIQLRAAVDQNSARAWVMVCLEGASQVEAASVLGMSRQKVQRAIKHVDKALEPMIGAVNQVIEEQGFNVDRETVVDGFHMLVRRIAGLCPAAAA